jgi:hypothetical protein
MGGIRQFTGTYSSSFEHSGFVPMGSHEEWWFDGAYPCPQIEPFPENPMDGTWPVRVVVDGVVSRRGKHGHMGRFVRNLRVTRVISCERIEFGPELKKPTCQGSDCKQG